MDRRTFLHVGLAGVGALAVGCGPEAAVSAEPLPLGEGLLAFAHGQAYELEPLARRISQGGVAVLSDLNYPVALAELPGDGVAVLDRGDGVVVVVEGGRVRRLGADVLGSPVDLAVSDGLLFVTDAADHTVVVLDLQGRERARWAGFSLPRGIATGPDGTLHVVDTGHGRVRTFAPDGTEGPSYGAGADWWMPRPVAVDGAGYAYVGCPTRQAVYVFAPDGALQDRRPLAVSPVHLSISDAGQVHVGAV
ncbi:MAG: hypothetical protein H6702_06140 [Myxococcales bacterium]|nr:hypothetical protein [Myxococcales bacterium]